MVQSSAPPSFDWSVLPSGVWRNETTFRTFAALDAWQVKMVKVGGSSSSTTGEEGGKGKGTRHEEHQHLACAARPTPHAAGRGGRSSDDAQRCALRGCGREQARR